MDKSAFETPAQRHRSGLHLHCSRVLASVDEAEDAVQKKCLRARQRS
jgi:DNA-directed RNA polymerase specialized sigma24 family protein